MAGKGISFTPFGHSTLLLCPDARISSVIGNRASSLVRDACTLAGTHQFPPFWMMIAHRDGGSGRGKSGGIENPREAPRTLRPSLARLKILCSSSNVPRAFERVLAGMVSFPAIGPITRRVPLPSSSVSLSPFFSETVLVPSNIAPVGYDDAEGPTARITIKAANERSPNIKQIPSVRANRISFMLCPLEIALTGQVTDLQLMYFIWTMIDSFPWIVDDGLADQNIASGGIGHRDEPSDEYGAVETEAFRSRLSVS